MMNKRMYLYLAVKISVTGLPIASWLLSPQYDGIAFNVDV